MSLKRLICVLLLAAITLCFAGCSEGVTDQEAEADTASDIRSAVDSESADDTDEEVFSEESEENIVYIKIGEHILTATLAQNSSVEALVDLLKDGDITIDAHDYGSFEKVGSLGTSLPRNDEYITTEPGDIILYQGNQITVYYDTNSWSLTRLGRINDISQDELKEILGKSDVTLTLTLSK